MFKKLCNQRTVNIIPCQLVARVKSVEEFSETAPCLATAESIAVIAIKTFPNLNVINKLI